MFKLYVTSSQFPGFGQRGEEITGSVGAKPPAANEFFRLSHKKTLFLTHFYIEKGHAVSAVTTSVARILQWKVENDITFDDTLYTRADPESFGGVHVILN